MTELASAQVELKGNSKPRVGNMTILADNKNIATGELIIPHVIISSEEVETGTFRGQISFTLIRA